MRCLRILLLAIGPWMMALSSSVVEAGVVVTVLNAQFAHTGNGTLDVLIRSDANDTLSNFGFNLRIDPLGGTTSQLRFATAQSDLQLIDANYIFAAGSLKRDGDPSLLIPPEPVGSVFTDAFPNDSYIGTDSYTLLAPPSITLSNTNLLLARLELTPGPGLLAPVVGDQFSISLVDGPFTSFLDENFTEIPYTFTSGTVTITAVPEPGTLLTTLLLGLAFGSTHIGRRLRVYWTS